MAGPGRAGGTGGLDWFRPVAAALVVAIHTGPLLSWDTGVNYLLTDILARVAVPFFFAVTGFFLLPRVAERGWRALAPFLGRTALLYAGKQTELGYIGHPFLVWLFRIEVPV